MENSRRTYDGRGMDVIILAGQSNAEGCGRGEAAEPYRPTEDVWYYSSPFVGEIVTPADGVEFQVITYPCEPFFEIAAERDIEGTVSDFSLSFAREYIRAGLLKSGRRLVIVRAGVGGTGFAKGFWKPGGVCFLRLREMIERLKETGDCRFVAFLWHQGEHDAFENPSWSERLREKEYGRNLRMVIAAVRAQCGNARLPVIAGEFCAHWAAQNRAVCLPVLIATKKTLRAEGFGRVVSSEGLLSNSQSGAVPTDPIHFCRQALYELGKRYYVAYRALVAGTKEEAEYWGEE